MLGIGFPATRPILLPATEQADEQSDERKLPVGRDFELMFFGDCVIASVRAKAPVFFEGEIVKVGTWMYDDTVLCVVRIIRADVLQGSGDYEDPPEVRDDCPGEFFHVVFESTEAHQAHGGVYHSLENAVQHVESVVRVRWNADLD